MARKPEGKLQDKMIAHLRKLRAGGQPIYWLKITVNQFMRAGTPDLLVCHRGRALMLEIKQPGERARPEQEHEMKLWRTAGAVSCVITSIEELEVALKIS